MDAKKRPAAIMQTFAEYMAESFNSDAKLVWDYPGSLTRLLRSALMVSR
jgi:hypothetical protein